MRTRIRWTQKGKDFIEEVRTGTTSHNDAYAAARLFAWFKRQQKEDMEGLLPPLDDPKVPPDVIWELRMFEVRGLIEIYESKANDQADLIVYRAGRSKTAEELEDKDRPDGATGLDFGGYFLTNKGKALLDIALRDVDLPEHTIDMVEYLHQVLEEGIDRKEYLDGGVPRRVVKKLFAQGYLVHSMELKPISELYGSGLSECTPIEEEEV